MRKVIAAINMSLDGVFDHAAMTPDEEVYLHFNELLRNAGALLYGRITYQLMESYWPTLVKKPSGNRVEDEFAVLIDDIPKIVFSHTLKGVEWKNARLAKQGIKEEVLELKQQPGKPILAGSRSIIMALLNLGLVDELQICVHPIIAGKGALLFKDISDRIELKLVKTKAFMSSGAVVVYYGVGKRGLRIY